MTAWIIGALVALGGIVFAVAKADLEDPDVCRWLACKFIDRAARRLPRGERARWREESMRDVLDLPGRLPPLAWALDVYVRSGRWGRMRGAPTRWQALVARTRAVWRWLRSLPSARELQLALRGRAEDQAETQPAQVRTVALDANLVAASVTRSGGSAALGSPRKVRVAFGWWRDGLMHLSDEEFVVWLAQERQELEDHVDRQVEEWRQRRGRPPRG